MAKPKSFEKQATDEAQGSFYIHETIPMVVNNLKAQLDGRAMYIPCWAGAPGIGKTEHAKLIAKELGLEMLYFSMNKPYEALTGLPITSTISFDNDEVKRNSAYVYWSEPELIHLANEIAEKPAQLAEKANEIANKKFVSGKYANNGCLIFLDDIHIMSPDVQKCFFEFVLERKLGNHRLSPRTAILAAMNNSAMAGFDGFLSAINARIERIDVKMSFDYWYENCGADLNPYVACYLRNAKQNISEKENTQEPFATHRSWSKLSEHLNPVVEKYHQTKDKVWFLNQVYMYARGYISNSNAIELKNSVAQQIEYDFEGMVRHNRYQLDINSVFSQLSFGNVVRYFRDKKDVDNFIKFIRKLLSENTTFESVQNAILNIMYELLSHTTMYEKRSDPESKKKLELYRYAQDEMFNNGDPIEGSHRIHKIINNLLNNKFSIN